MGVGADINYKCRGNNTPLHAAMSIFTFKVFYKESGNEELILHLF